MNRIHPGIILALLGVLALFLYGQKSGLEKQFVQEQMALHTLQERLELWSEGKRQWSESILKLKSLLKDPLLQGIQQKEEVSKNSFIMNLEGMTPEQLNTFVNKLLNSTVVIKKLTVSKFNDLNVVRIEISQ